MPVKSIHYATTFGKYTILDATQMHLIRDKGVCHVITGYVANDNLDAAELSDSIYQGKQIAFYFAEFVRKYIHRDALFEDLFRKLAEPSESDD